MKKVFVQTFGCQMNVYDTGKIHALLGKDGFESTDSMNDADVIIVNTCSIREKPELKLHSFLGDALKIKRTEDRPVTVAVAGCVAQQEGQKLLNRYRELDLVFGPDAVPRVRELVDAARSDVPRATKQVLDTEFLDLETYAFASELDPGSTGQVGAFVTIQKGCDNKCTFCIVPTTRGPEVSRSSDQILEEVKGLADTGVREITLIGQNVNSYGLKVAGERTFAQLLYAVSDVPGVERIRYTTSHPRDMGPDVIQAYRDLPKLTSHLHLPVQSGSDRVLRRMKRFYNREHYLSLVDQLRDARPDMVLSTDFILGFPGETDEDFEQTMSLLDEVAFESSFSFKYSQRPGTSALRLLKDEVAPDVAQARLVRLQQRQREISIAAHESLSGQTMDVLVEGPSRYDEGVVCGRTSTFKMINFPGTLDLVGKTVPVSVIRGFTNSLRGEWVH
ncbi:MAG: tRNA (N6-isopentenyl adenosine(37)-C2)-methylthiotransferase MiaB [Deltaproteobacteria bacterium]|nr:tRNA (N6-isopentenyl adenosine(37)-C2)-methylthiotransferase MiaB [Deltaproteobacteria bacterium]